jgi:hypothetical protein
MDRQAIDVHGRIAFSNANCALPKTGQKRRWRKVRFWHQTDMSRWSDNGGLRWQSGHAVLAWPLPLMIPSRALHW